MTPAANAADVLEREFLEIRARILELGASLDRIGRAEGSAAHDPRLAQIHEAIEALRAERNDRAEQIQLIFSLPYDDQWQDEFFPAEK